MRKNRWLMSRGLSFKVQYDKLLSILQIIINWTNCTVLQSSERLHQEWLERERIAQEEFSLKREREEAAQKRKEEEEVSNR